MKTSYSIRFIYCVTVISMVRVHGDTNSSFAAMLPYIVPVTTGAALIVNIGWNWWNSSKISRIDKNIEFIAADVKDIKIKAELIDKRVANVQAVQAEHTRQLTGLESGQKTLQASSDKNFKAVSQDMHALTKLTKDRFDGVDANLKSVKEGIDSTRGSLEIRLDRQAKELADIKALLNAKAFARTCSVGQDPSSYFAGQSAATGYNPVFPASTDPKLNS